MDMNRKNDITVDVKIVPDDNSEQSVNIEKGTTYEDLLKKLDINEESVIVLKDGNATPLDGVVESGKIQVLKITSGG
ncbi:MoaD/ThiS family protein [Methanohalobium sp.]|uniref:MoaD/ThiS family protein n=1 Tax=Methanohalobium sp. TaxID=2837493 RepID=UPI0025FF9FFA|nr:MoaD/ThiS family protein [Methanohalobium sp.]